MSEYVRVDAEPHTMLEAVKSDDEPVDAAVSRLIEHRRSAVRRGA